MSSASAKAALASADPHRQLIGFSADGDNVTPMSSQRLLTGFPVAMVVLLAACSSATPAVSGPPGSSATPTASGSPGSSANPTGQMTQTSDGGQVTVVVDWPDPAGGAVFDVTLDTHSVDLDALDLADAILRNDRGDSMPAQPWAAPKGGHHREGALTFGGDTARFLAGARWIELVRVGVGDLPERTLRWEVAS